MVGMLFPGAKSRSGPQPPAFVEFQHGMFTASGTWFHTTRADLEAYAPAVLDRIGIERLIRDAETVLRSPQALTLWVLLGLLAVVSPFQAALSAVLVHLGWSVLAPGLVTLPLVRFYRLLDPVPLQGLVYVAILSVLANQGHLAALGTGLAGFVIVRWGLLARVTEPPAAVLRRSLFRLPPPDQCLRAVIVRHALATGAPLAELDAMERRMLEFAARRTKGRRSDAT